MGVLWFDAHADFDTPDEASSGYLDAMGVATLAGQCWRGLAGTIPGHRPLELAKLTYCGIRDFGPGQREKVEALGIRAAFGELARQVDFAAALVPHLSARQARTLVHLDLDCLDTSLGAANDYAAPGGLLAQDLVRCLALVLATARPAALTIASFYPDSEGSKGVTAAALDAVTAFIEHLQRRPHEGDFLAQTETCA